MKKILLVLFLMIFLVGTISAFEFDNIKEVPQNFNYQEDTIIIKNSFLGMFPLGKVADIKLISNTDQCLINCKTKFRVKLYSDYDNPLTREYFKDRKNRDVNANGEWYYYDNSSYDVEVSDYKKVCELDPKSINGSQICIDEKTGSHNEIKYNSRWLKYKGGTFKQGEYEFEYRGQKPTNKEIDFKMELFGVDLGEEYVWWNGDWNYKRLISDLTGDIIYLNITYDSNMNASFEDIRFLNNDNDLEYGYFLQEKVDSEWAVFRIRTINESSIYMYYGNLDASSNSNIENVYGSGLVSSYFFEGISGAVIDGTGLNDAINLGPTRGVDGKIGNAFDFEATDPDVVYVLAPNNMDNMPNITWNHWLKTENITTSIMLRYNQDITGNTVYSDYISGTKYICVVVTDGGAVSVTSIADVTTDWQMLTCQWNGTSTNIYINGALDNSVNGGSGDVTDIGGAKWTLGGQWDGSDTSFKSFWDGIMDEVMLWNQTLNSTEIGWLYNVTEPVYVLGDQENVTAVEIVLNSPIDNYNSSSQTIIFNGTVWDNTGVVNVSLILDGIYNETNSSGINNSDYIFTKIISDGSHNWTYEACDDEDNCTIATERNFTIEINPPNINIESPTGTLVYNVIGQNETLNVTFTDVFLDSCWYNYNGTNITINGCLTGIKNSTTFILEAGNMDMFVYANDTFGNLNITYQQWNYTLLENSQEFNNETLEGVMNIFTANITINESNPITIANFIYNETSSIGSFSKSGNDYILTIDYLAPNIDINTDLIFFWSVIFSDNQVINLTSYNQTVNTINLDDCSVNSIVLYNYTIVDEENQTLLINTTAELSISFLDTERQNYVVNFSKKYSNINPFAVCINENLSSSGYSVDSIAKYESIDYSIEYYNIADATITNSTIPNEIILYDLLLADATEFKITFKAEDFTFVEDALIFIDRQYISENNTFKTVELPKTDSEGQTIGHFVRNDVVYNIRVIKDGVVLGNFINKIAYCDDFTIGDCQMILEAIPADFDFFNYDEQLGIIFQSLPTYNENASSISFDFSTDDGSVKTVVMEVTRDDIFGNRSICNNTITSSSGTLSCSFDPDIDDSILRVDVSVDDQPIILSNVKLDASVYGNLGYVLWFFLTFFFLMIFAHSKTEILIGLAVSFIGAISLGIIRGDIIGFGSAGIWVLVIIILGIYKLNNEKPQ